MSFCIKGEQDFCHVILHGCQSDTIRDSYKCSPVWTSLFDSFDVNKRGIKLSPKFGPGKVITNCVSEIQPTTIKVQSLMTEKIDWGSVILICG